MRQPNQCMQKGGEKKKKLNEALKKEGQERRKTLNNELCEQHTLEKECQNLPLCLSIEHYQYMVFVQWSWTSFKSRDYSLYLLGIFVANEYDDWVDVNAVKTLDGVGCNVE